METNPDADTLVVTLVITNPEGKEARSEYCTKGLQNEAETTITLGATPEIRKCGRKTAG